MTAPQSDLLARRQAAVPRGPFNIMPIFVDRALGARLWDVDGREYLDFCGGIGVLNVGHNHPKVVAAVKAQCDRYFHTSWHVVMYEPYVQLAERLNQRLPIPGPNKTLFFNSGAEATENAVKIARAHTRRQAVVTFERGFHGRTLLAMSMTGKVTPYTQGFGPFAPEIYRLPWEPFFALGERTDGEVEAACRQELKKLCAYHIEPEQIACILLEPVLGEGGFFPIHPAAFRLLRDFCSARGILLICDEVQSGFGRCGALFACQRYGIQPDLMVMAKALGGGLPLSAVGGPAEIMDVPQVGGLGGTYGGNPLACVAGLAVLEILDEEALCSRAEAIGHQVMETFRDLAAGYDFLTRPRGLGAMCGLEIVSPETGEADAQRANEIVKAAREGGLLIMTASGNVLRTLMPLTISDQELHRGLDILRAAMATSAGKTAMVAAAR